MKHTMGHRDCSRQLRLEPGCFREVVVLQGLLLPAESRFTLAPDISALPDPPPPFGYFSDEVVDESVKVAILFKFNYSSYSKIPFTTTFS